MDIEKQINQMPLLEQNSGEARKKYFTAEEAMIFMEPRIRSMFR